jgi:hypothetical protein
LEADFVRCEFFLIRDHDYLSAESVAKHSAIASGRLFILERHQIENYLLDEVVLADVLKSIFQKQVSAADVRAQLFEIVLSNSAAFLRDMVVMRYAEIYQQEDCSIGNHSQAMSLTSNGQPNTAVLDPLQRFTKEHELGSWPALQNLAIEAMAKIQPPSLSELRGIFQRIARGTIS